MIVETQKFISPTETKFSPQRRKENFFEIDFSVNNHNNRFISKLVPLATNNQLLIVIFTVQFVHPIWSKIFLALKA